MSARPHKLLNLSDDERASAQRVIDLLLEEADDLGAGTLARVWRAEAASLERELLPNGSCRSCAARDVDLDTEGVCAECVIAQLESQFGSEGGR